MQAHAVSLSSSRWEGTFLSFMGKLTHGGSQQRQVGSCRSLLPTPVLSAVEALDASLALEPIEAAFPGRGFCDRWRALPLEGLNAIGLIVHVRFGLM